jgi:hypothetical protein
MALDGEVALEEALDLSEGTGMNLPHKSVIDFAVYDELYY